MGDVRRFPDTKAEAREVMVAGLRTLADAIEQGIDDYDGIVVAGYYRDTELAEPYSYSLFNTEVSWIGAQIQNWALTEHYESLDYDD